MLFAELAEAELPSSLEEEVNKLLDLKINSRNQGNTENHCFKMIFWIRNGKYQS